MQVTGNLKASNKVPKGKMTKVSIEKFTSCLTPFSSLSVLPNGCDRYFWKKPAMLLGLAQ